MILEVALTPNKKLSFILCVSLLSLFVHKISAQDIYEPNNSFSTASVLTVGYDYQGHTISEATDVDYIRFDAVAGQGYTIEVTDEAGCDVRYYVYNHLQNVLGGAYTSTNSYISATTGVNYLRVYRYSGEDVGSYSVRVIPAYWNSDPAASWNSLLEPNQHCYNAPMISTDGTEYLCAIETGSDEDYMAFIAEKGITYTIELTETGGVDVRYYLVYENDFHGIETVSGAHTGQLEWTCQHPGRYQLRFYRYAGLTEGEYSVRITESSVTSGVTLSPKVLFLHPGDSYQLTAGTMNSGGISWSTSDDTKADVGSGGLVTAIGEGESVIRASLTSSPGYYDEARVIVFPADTYEPNNSYSTATELAVGYEYQGHTISAEADEDYIRFDAVAGQGYTIEVTDEAGCDVRYYVYNHLQNVIGGTYTSTNSYICATTGVNYLRVYRYSGEDVGSYSVRVIPAYWNSSPVVSWNTLLEPNLHWYNAPLISTDGTEYQYAIEIGSDEDYIAFIAEKGITYTIELSEAGGVDVRYYLNFENDFHGIETVSGAHTGQLEWTCQHPGRYQLRFYRYAGLTEGEYSVRITESSATSGVTLSPKVLFLQPGGSYQLTAGTMNSGGITWSTSDDTKADVGSGGLVTATGEGEAMIRASLTSSPGYYDEARVIILPADTYEPNNSFSTATALVVGYEHQGHTISAAGDEDYIRFDAVAGQGYTIEVTDEAGCDVRYYVYNHLQNVIGGAYTSTNSYICATTGVNYLRVYRYSGEDVGSYSVRVIPAYWNSSPVASWNALLEPNLHWYNAPWVQTNGNPYYSEIENTGDEDYIRFGAISGVTYVIALEDESAVDVRFYLYHEIGNHELEVISGSHTSQVEWTCTGTGVAVLRIYRYSGLSQGSYSLRISGGSSPFMLLSPVDNATVSSSTIPFSWTDAGASEYELIVDNNPDFSSPEVSADNHVFGRITETSYTLTANWLSEGTWYWKVRAFFGAHFVETAPETFRYSPEATTGQWVPLYRAFHADDIDHFYCSNDNHIITAIDGGYNFEGVEGFISLVPFGDASMRPVYRFWKQGEEGVQKGNRHLYCTEDLERDERINQGYDYEGIVGYLFGDERAGTVPMYRLSLDQSTPDVRKDNFYTTSEFERNNAIAAYGYTAEGILGYLAPFADDDLLTYGFLQPTVGNGINPYNGSTRYLSPAGFSIPEGRIGINFSHFYVSKAVRMLSCIRPLGPGWNHSYNIYLLLTDARIYLFRRTGIYVFDRSSLTPVTEGIYDILERVNDQRYRLITKDQQVFIFDTRVDDEAILPLSSITDRNDNTVNLVYNGRKLTQVELPSGRAIEFTYSNEPYKEHLVDHINDPIGRTVSFRYDIDENLVAYIDAMGDTTRYEYLPSSRWDYFLSKITLPEQQIIENVFNTATKRVERQNFGTGGAFITTEFDNITRTATITDDLNNTMQLVYSSDPVNPVVEEILTGAGNYTVECTDSQNPKKVTKITDGNGNSTTLSYDNRGNTLHINRPYGIQHNFTYTSLNDIERSIGPLLDTTKFSYDVNGNLSVISTYRDSTRIFYNSKGLADSVIGPLGRRSRYFYDTFDNVDVIRDPLGHSWQFEYDNVGRLTGTEDPKGNRGATAFNDNDQPVRTVGAVDDTTLYGYDRNGNLVTVENALHRSTVLSYSSSTDLLESLRNPLDEIIRYHYTGSHLIKKEYASGDTIGISYDNAGRVASYNGSIAASFEYNGNNSITKVIEGSDEMTFGYDSLNRLLWYEDYYGNRVRYSWDKAGNCDTIFYPEGNAVAYTYYRDNLLHTVNDWLGNVTTYYYRNDKTIDSMVYPNGIRCYYHYDNAGQITGIANVTSAGDTINGYSFTLDEVGNIISEDRKEPYAEIQPPVQNVTCTYDAANRLQTAGAITYSHDSNGNMTGYSGSGPAIDYGFDHLNRLLTVDSNGVRKADYTYDIYGNRRSATRNGTRIEYVLDIAGPMSRVLMEKPESGDPVYYVHGLGMVYRITTGNTLQCYLYDLRGSTIAITDAGENITHKYAYSAYGKVLADSGNDDNAYKYVGKYGVMDEGNGLYFMRARYYDPEIKRFISEDPVWGVNLYGYCNMNPLNGIDPEGKEMRIYYRKAFNNNLIQHAMLYSTKYKLAVGLDKTNYWGGGLGVWKDDEATKKINKNENAYDYVTLNVPEEKEAAIFSALLSSRPRKFHLGFDSWSMFNNAWSFFFGQDPYFFIANDCHTVILKALKENGIEISPGLGLNRINWDLD